MYNPGDIQWVPFPDQAVSAVDRIVAKAKIIGIDEGRVETTKHWDLVEDIFKLWVKFFPQEYHIFYKQQIDLKRSQENQHGSKREKGGAEVQHVVEIPQRFYSLLTGIFPDIDKQLFGSKSFAIKLVRRLPVLGIPEKI